jgi:hypothetical protein
MTRFLKTRLSSKLGELLLSIWLIASGLLSLLDLGSSEIETVLQLLAIAAGGLLLYEISQKELSKRVGQLLLAIWLVTIGLVPLLGLSFSNRETILALLALAAGTVILYELYQTGELGQLGQVLLGIWLLVNGLISILELGFSGQEWVLALLTLAAGTLRLLDR